MINFKKGDLVRECFKAGTNPPINFMLCKPEFQKWDPDPAKVLLVLGTKSVPVLPDIPEMEFVTAQQIRVMDPDGKHWRWRWATEFERFLKDENEDSTQS